MFKHIPHWKLSTSIFSFSLDNRILVLCSPGDVTAQKRSGHNNTCEMHEVGDDLFTTGNAMVNIITYHTIKQYNRKSTYVAAITTGMITN